MGDDTAAVGVNPDGVWIDRLSSAQFDEAASAAEAETAGPLTGSRVAVKDNIDVAGFATTAACPSYAYDPARSAPAVARLEAAGAVVVGKTNLDQFATGLVGTRSPYGIVANPRRPGFISGGSSSGSAAAVAAGEADIGVGTDTAGSGRVPPALCGLFGLKGTRGWVPNTGVVPACASFDCTTVMAADLPTAVTAMRAMAGHDPTDPSSRRRPATRPGPVRRLGVPSAETLAGCSDEVIASHTFAVELARAAGYDVTVLPADALDPYLAAGALLYGGAFVAERAAAVGSFIDGGPDGPPDGLDETVATIIGEAAGLTATDYARDRGRLAALTIEADRVWAEVDAVLLPTVPFHPTIDEVLADPIAVNGHLGRFVSGANLVDWCAIVFPPSAPDTGPTPIGAQLLGPAWSDETLWEATATMLDLPLPTPALTVEEGYHLVAVVGAHLDGQPLNHQLTTRRGRLVRTTRTAPAYRMVLIEGAVAKPGLFRDAAVGASFEVEVWALDAAGFGRFVDEVPAPLAIGTLELEDGSTVNGFVCEPEPAAEATDISVHGGWRAWLATP